MRNIPEEKIADLICKIDALMPGFEFMNAPDEEWRDDSNIWVKLDHLAHLRHQLIFNRSQMGPGQVQRVFKRSVRLFNSLNRHLSPLSDFAPDYSNEKDVLVTPKPATAGSDTCGPTVVISEGKKKKISFEKTIQFCGYFFPKKFREEAKGDIYETRHEMRENGCSKTAIFIVTAFKIISLILGSLRIRLSDLAKPENEINK